MAAMTRSLPLPERTVNSCAPPTCQEMRARTASVLTPLGQPPESAMTWASSGTTSSSGVVEVTVGEDDLDRAVRVAALDALAPLDDLERRIDRAQHVVELGQARHLGESAAHLGTDRDSPTRTSRCACGSRATHAPRRRTRRSVRRAVPACIRHRLGDLPHPPWRRGCTRPPLSTADEVAEQPRTAETTATDHDAVTPGAAASCRRRRPPPRCRRCPAPARRRPPPLSSAIASQRASPE